MTPKEIRLLAELIGTQDLLVATIKHLQEEERDLRRELERKKKELEERCARCPLVNYPKNRAGEY